jgi:pimeloyl-ACP methyl ester carboxylesterase
MAWRCGLALLLSLAIGGAGAAAARSQPFFQVGGARVHALTSGSGGPAVVFISGMGEDLATWRDVQPAVANLSTTLVYDRPGLGRSTPAPGIRHARAMAVELHALIEVAGVPRPVILVGHSLGAWVAVVFAHEYPADTAGLVLVDPAFREGRLREMLSGAEWAAREALLAKYATGMSPAQRDEKAGLDLSGEQAFAAVPLPPVPVQLLSGARTNPAFPFSGIEKDVKFDEHRRLLAGARSAGHVVVETARHYIQNEAPSDVVLAVSKVLASARGSQPATPAWHGLLLGPHAVGFRRAGPDDTMAMWYPAANRGSAMALRDYYDEASARDYAKVLAGAGVSAAAVKLMLDSPMAASKGAAAHAGLFPVVLVAQGNAQTAPDQAVLSEYLASHGYVVVTTPSPMVETPMTSEDQVGALAERQARELEAALTAAGALDVGADTARAGAVGHSFGARAALLIAMRNKGIRAVVSLDGGIGTAIGSSSFRAAPSFDARKATAPVLHFYERLDAFMAPDFTLLNSLASPKTIQEVPDMHHIHFTTLGFLALRAPEVATLTGAGPRIADSLTRVARGTLDFIETHLRARGR